MIIILFLVHFSLMFSFFFRHIFFPSLIPSFSLFTASNRTQNSITRQNFDVFFTLILISIVIYTSLFTLNCLYLFTIICTYALFMVLFSSFCLQLQRKINPLLWRKCSLKLDLKKSEFLKGFCNLFVFGFFFRIMSFLVKTMIFYGEENVQSN